MPETGDLPIKQEQQQKPEVLWRAYTVDPRTLSLELLSAPLTPGNIAKDPDRTVDGNELGVYMSTNRTMVESAYARGSFGLSAPKHNDRGLIRDTIDLPMCAVVVKVDTKGLEIRKPKIIPVMQGVYNNGFQGEEWIADIVPPENYNIEKLVLSRYAYDNDRFELEVENNDADKLQEAIDTLKEEFKTREQKARNEVKVLESMDPTQRLSERAVKQALQVTNSKLPGRE